MANTVLTPTVVTREVGRILHNNLTFCRTINRQYDDSHKMTGQRDGGSIKLRTPAKYTTTTGAAISIQDHTDTSVTLTRGTQRHVDVNFTTEELTQDLDDFSTRVLEPAISTLASVIDYDAMSMYQQIYNHVGTPGTTPATAGVLLDAHKYMNYFAAPVTPRYCCVNPDANAALVDGLKGLFNAPNQIADQYKSGLMGSNTLGFKEFSMSQSVRTHTTGSGAATSILVDEPSATLLVEGMQTVDMDGGSASETLAVGDVFTFANVYSVNPETKQSTGQLQQCVITAVATASTGQWTAVAFSPALYTSTSGGLQNVDALPVNNAAVTVVGSASTQYPQNIAYHPDAFVLATADLEMPKGVHFAAREVMDNISVRAVRQYRIATDDIPCRFDVLYGYVAWRPELACRISG